MKNVLWFDSKPIEKEVWSMVQRIIDDASVQPVTVDRYELLHARLKNMPPFDILLINFEMKFFSNMNGRALKNFVKHIKKGNNESLRVIGTSEDSYLTKLLKKADIEVINPPQGKVFVIGLTLESIGKTVCECLKVPYESILEKGRGRKNGVIAARQISMFLSKKHTKSSLADIGDFFSGLHHSTVIHALDTVKNLMDTEEEYRKTVQELSEKIQNVYA